DCEGSIEEVLKIALKESGMTYVIKDKEIILKPVPVTQNAQQKKRIIKGSVIDAETKEPIIGANVWVKETTIGAVTDVNGNYSLSVNANVGLVVASYLGYKDMEVMAGDKTEIQFKLVPDAEALEEVMVIAYGSQKKESVIGAISSVDIAKLKVPTSNISNNLAGQLAGIVAVTRSGEPGSGSEFYIRGISTFGANKNPLVLVDGIERSLDLVDPEDIASFSILKDATATAVYGVRGANGVILISTRKGADGAPRINVKAEMGILGPSKMPKMANSAQFAEMYNEASGSKYYSQEVIDKYANGTDPDLYPDVNWIDELYQDFTSNQRVNVNISGGGSIAKYYIAGSIYNEGSIFKSDNSNDYNSSINYNKINFRANLDLNLSKST
ncbi:MAG: SusC/RagA family TonB-linked outer membrane protein, partial [Parabacteroides sp.]|nr:SusC/RagA family TonB-linked outer membrane protein [Parabacteroides sp.]